MLLRRYGVAKLAVQTRRERDEDPPKALPVILVVLATALFYVVLLASASARPWSEPQPSTVIAEIE